MLALLMEFLPFFLLVALGWGATRGRLVPVDGIPAMNVFVLYFGLPAMLFRLGAGGSLQQAGLGGLMLVYALAGVVMVGLALTWATRQRLSRLDGGMTALVTAFPNTGFLGLPLLTGLLGHEAAGPLAATIVVDVLLFSSCCLAWAYAKAPGGSHAVWTSLRGAARNPLLWSMAAGMAFNAVDGVLPVPLERTVALLAQAASPAALFTLGAILARAQLKAQGEEAEAVRPVWWLSGLKLAVHPALVWGLGRAAQHAGLPVTDAGLLALTLAAALPAASNVSMLAERIGAHTQVVPRIIWWSTVLALLSLSLWARALDAA